MPDFNYIDDPKFLGEIDRFWSKLYDNWSDAVGMSGTYWYSERENTHHEISIGPTDVMRDIHGLICNYRHRIGAVHSERMWYIADESKFFIFKMTYL